MSSGGLGFGPSGISECEDCGEEFNSITSYDFSGKLCNKCSDAKRDKKDKKESEKESEQDSEQDEEQDEEQESEKEPEKDMFGFPVKATKKGKDKGICKIVKI